MVMPDKRSDPEGYNEVWQAKHKEACRAYVACEFPMSDAVFEATLYTLGFHGVRLQDERRYWAEIKYRQSQPKAS